ncbi:TIGR04290 family methyltransferase [Paracoccus sp. MC1862]|uniref:TIGR04290 family methyltransferase n=1 Tax=Paracoccus sp. MC1862 TaxID=2760307 RepID=UPI00160199B7|nr:TIGR04290 family methyltransferase [Paracoccus sp. MC1862]MBB1496558.1 TIGR04290 family methyltransferase [Paracoccus sp. MC1862]QQO43581.1 TIGR04290 family methyltransferase [Paracoccus sp. MC1862]
MNATQIAKRIEGLGPWFQNLDLNGVRTAPEHFLGDYPADKFARFAHLIPADLTGKTVLDIGCNAGFYSFEMRRRGAARVLGIDSDPRYLAQARLAAEVLGDGVEFRQMGVYDVAALGERFDLVIFMGVLYHLRHPLLALDLIREYVAGDMMLFQTLTRGPETVAVPAEDYDFSEDAHFQQPDWPRMTFIEGKWANDWTNWWVPNRAGVEAMLRASGFAVEDGPADEVYLCRTAKVPFAEYGPHAVYPSQGDAAR